ncbi:FCD domain-containing protein [Rhizobium sp. NLR9b]|uniref:FCD domain-containing protein n=1 Tax=Rhizobium TaxID=379 RepID=UPI002180D1D9|nr:MULTISPECIES: FCD domain-containing protein [Rhizobium]MBX5230671.1 FCD domain-containing protein [Rhizobium sp. NLR9b]MBX5291335.1 FCD domain-containing protein [Rhizobium sp. NLR10b]MBY3516537.1 FCD domain-containing protein [Rhizobium laguerreae]
MAELERTSGQNSPLNVLDATTEFYKIVFETAGHNIAWENSRISRLRVMTLSTSNRRTSGPSQVNEIFAAIDANDPGLAAAACRAHVNSAAAIGQTILG